MYQVQMAVFKNIQRFSATRVVILFPAPFFWWQPDFLSSLSWTTHYSGCWGPECNSSYDVSIWTPSRSSILLVQLMGSDEVHTPMT